VLLDRLTGQRFAALVDHVNGQRGRLCFERCLVLVLLQLGGLPGLAYASLPDPAWLPGIYDGADYDDAVVGLTDTCAVANARPQAFEPARLLTSVPFSSASAPADASLLSVHLRSPPNT